MENRLNKLANLTGKKDKEEQYVRIKIYKRDENA